MPVFLPTAVLADSGLLVTLGGAGEVMGLFYPSADHAQNVCECLPAAYAQSLPLEPFCWLFEARWQRTQAYADGSAILLTDLTCLEAQLGIQLTDLVSPDAPVLARRFVVANSSDEDVDLALMQYSHLALGDVPTRQAVRYLAGPDAIVQSHRDIAIAVGGDRLDGFRCGRAGDQQDHSAKADMLDGELTGQAEDIGRVDFAVSWKLGIPASGTVERVLYVAAGRSEAEAVERLEAARAAGFAALCEARRAADSRRLGSLKGLPVSASRRSELDRAVLALCALQDEGTGGIVAAPEFDPTFRASGGYGFCWPRDGAYAALTLTRLGMGDRADAFLGWCARAQREDGLWWQRYWADGIPGPCWCGPDRLEQLDESASVLHALGRRFAAVPDGQREHFARRFGEMARRGVTALVGRVRDDGLHAPAMDLWESFRGAFAYTSAAIHAALRDTAPLLEATGDHELAQRARAKAEAIREAVLGRLWLGSHMARGLHLDGTVDGAVDSSVLGVWEPFGLLSAADETDYGKLTATVATIEEHLGLTLDAGPAVFRFQFDTYLGGAAGGVNTLWLALTLFRAAAARQQNRPAEADSLRRRAARYFETCRRRLAGVGLVPELIGRPGQPPYWAAPHAWATALYSECLLALDGG